MSLNDRTVSFYKNAKIENRKKEGQYMTPTNIVKETINNIPFNQSDIILEPSYGTGQFFDELIKMKHKSIYGVEKDKEIFDSSKNDYKKYKLFNDNYLTKQSFLQGIKKSFTKSVIVSEHVLSYLFGVALPRSSI